MNFLNEYRDLSWGRAYDGQPGRRRRLWRSAVQAATLVAVSAGTVAASVVLAYVLGFGDRRLTLTERFTVSVVAAAGGVALELRLRGRRLARDAEAALRHVRDETFAVRHFGGLMSPFRRVVTPDDWPLRDDAGEPRDPTDEEVVMAAGLVEGWRMTYLGSVLLGNRIERSLGERADIMALELRAARIRRTQLDGRDPFGYDRWGPSSGKGADWWKQS